jgi:hypothetical protein
MINWRQITAPVLKAPVAVSPQGLGTERGQQAR